MTGALCFYASPKIKSKRLRLSYIPIPNRFRYGIRYTPEDALALTLFRLSAPKRLKYCVEYFNRLGWLSTVFNDVCVHLDRRYTSKLEWYAAFLTPERLEAYCEHVHANGEPSGI
jgi:hypothetical protein